MSLRTAPDDYTPQMAPAFLSASLRLRSRSAGSAANFQFMDEPGTRRRWLRHLPSIRNTPARSTLRATEYTRASMRGQPGDGWTAGRLLDTARRCSLTRRIQASYMREASAYTRARMAEPPGAAPPCHQ